MKKKIIFLESFTKKKTIQSFLGKEYIIFATSGHLLKIKNSGIYNLGINFKNFEPIYEIIPEKKKMIDFWKNFLKKEEIEIIYLALDSDREGEGIAKEIKEILKLSENKYKRLLFYEITPKNINNSLKNPVKIDSNLVEAQKSRQVLDKMIGFCISPIIRKKLNAFSAGRIQSVVLKLIVEREKIIEKQKEEKKYIINIFSLINNNKINLKEVKENKELMIYEEKKVAEETVKKLNFFFTFYKKEETENFIFSKQPFVTSSLLFEAKKKLNFSVSKTTKICQKLYEGLWIEKIKKRIGLITYPRTDSFRINKEFSEESYKIIEKKWGKEYCNFFPIWNKIKKKNVQDAHESIHPTYLYLQPEEIKNDILEEEYLLYKMIFFNSFACLMSSTKIKKKYFFFLNETKIFLTTEKIFLFEGFMKCNIEEFSLDYNIKKKSYLEKIKKIESNKIKIDEYIGKKIFRYNEGNLIQKLEELKIGRPSTYNTFGAILIKRRYVELNKIGQFVPTNLGIKLNEWIQKNFSYLINEEYTALLEEDLDKISRGEKKYFFFIFFFWKKFNEEIKKTFLEK